jgi:VWFA-related protein
MRVATILVPAILAGVACLAFAQSPTDGLPSAPSATQQAQQEKAQPPAPPAAKPEQSPAQTPSTPSSSPSTPAEQQKSEPAKEEPAATSAPGKAPVLENTAPEKQSDDIDESLITIRRAVDEVNVVFTVTDKHGRFVKDLKRNDFKVVDDAKPASEIKSFRSETDLPLQVGLLVDASNSVRDRFKFEQESAIEFLNQIIRLKYDRAFVVGFDVTPEVMQDFTDNTEQLSKGVRALRPGGGTAMYDALYFACRDKLLKAPSRGTVRRAIILLSDGEDNQSHVSREEAIEMAQRAEVIVYTISTNITGSRAKGDKILERIAEATGGRAFFPFQIRDVADAFAEIQDELRSQYALSYKPADFRQDGHYRTIEIIAQDKKNLKVRARRGYYAPTSQ